MWFGKSKIKRRRRPDRARLDERRSNRLRVQSRVILNSKTGLHWLRGFLVLLLSLLSLAAVLGASLYALNHYLLKQNDLFRIRDFNIKCSGDVIKDRHVRDYAGLEGASNLFALNIAEKRDSLQKQARVKSVKISRILPGDLEIVVQERVPFARLEMSEYYLIVDREGCVLGPSTAVSRLAVISGYSIAGLQPGRRLAGTPVMNALEVFNICETTQFRDLFKVLQIDLGNREALELRLGGGERVLLAWPQMGQVDTLDPDRLEKKLLKLAEILKTAAARGKRVASLDMTLENDFPTPEYY